MSSDAIRAAGKPTGHSTRKLHTSEQAADLLQCKARWLEEQARQRRIPFSMIGGAYRFSDAHLEEIIRIFEERPESQPVPPGRRRSRTTATAGEGVTPLQARRPRRTTRHDRPDAAG